jgi:hypothetical protein
VGATIGSYWFGKLTLDICYEHLYALDMVLDQLSIRQIEGLDDGEIDPKELSSVVDRLQLKFCQVVNRARERGEHRVFSPNISAVGWVADICSMSRTSAAGRLCVGKQIESLPKVAEALRAGEIGYQPVAVICHLNEQLAEKGDRVRGLGGLRPQVLGQGIA